MTVPVRRWCGELISGGVSWSVARSMGMQRQQGLVGAHSVANDIKGLGWLFL